MRDKKKLLEVIQTYTNEPYKTVLSKLIKSSIRLKTNGKSSTKLGDTKLGGLPDLPIELNWPKNNSDNFPFSFLGQINLKEVNKFDEMSLLPKSGIIYFFLNLESYDEGCVIYSKLDDDLFQATPPTEFNKPKKPLWKRILTRKHKQRIIKESAVEIFQEFHIPSWDSLSIERLQKLSDIDIKSIPSFKEDFYEKGYYSDESEMTSNHHILGYYKGIQNEFHELNFTEATNLKNLSIQEIDNALKWKLLFQIDSDDHLEFSWGDWGRIYFFIHETDLKNCNFDKVKIYGECY